MKFDKTYILSAFFLIFGFSILINSFWSFREKNNIQNEKSILRDINDSVWVPVDDSMKLFEARQEWITDGNKEINYEIIFAHTRTVCSACINEIFEYISLIEDRNQYINHSVYLFEDDSLKAMRYLSRTNFRSNIYYGYPIRLRHVIEKFDSNRILRQLIVYNRVEKEIVYRVILPNSGYNTPKDKKIAILNDIFEVMSK